MSTKQSIRIALVDDHKLFRKGISELINGFKGYEVTLEAEDGTDCIHKIKEMDGNIDVVLLDIKMKIMDGYATAKWLKKQYPEIKTLALSMYDREKAIIKMIKSGARGYVLKDCDPQELKIAIKEVKEKGFYHSDMVGKVLMNNIQSKTNLELKDREIEFLKWACTELTYKEIADRMCLATSTIEGYSENLLRKLGVKNRVGLVIYAIKNDIYILDE